MAAIHSTQQEQPARNGSGWGEEVLPGVFLTRKAGSAAEAAAKTGLGILANTLAYDGSSIDYRKVHARIKTQKDLIRRLEESNAYMTKYLAKEKRRREKRLLALGGGDSNKAATGADAIANEVSKAAETSNAAVPILTEENKKAVMKRSNRKKSECPSSSSDDGDDGDLQPITPEEDDRVIEESILENCLIIKDCKEEVGILNELVSMHHCMRSGNANEKTDTGAAAMHSHSFMRGADNDDAAGSDYDDSDDEEGEEDEEGYEEDDNAPFEEDVTGMHQTSTELSGGGRFAL